MLGRDRGIAQDVTGRWIGALAVPVLSLAFALLPAGAASAAGDPNVAVAPVSAPSSPVAIAPGSLQTFTFSNAGMRSTGALNVSLGTNPSTAGFYISSDTCARSALGPRRSCQVGVGYPATYPVHVQTATVTVESKTPKVWSASAFVIAYPLLNQRPVANFDIYHVTVGSTLAVASPGPLANDSDPDGDPLSMRVTSGTAFGDLSFSPDGSFTYVSGTEPPGDGIDSFNYVASDGRADSNLTMVDIVVDPPS